MAEISHFSHEHPLVLRKGFPASNLDEYGNSCYLCDLLPSQAEGDNEKEHVDAYVCEICNKFFLHKSCAQLSREIIHKRHDRHPLVLSKKSTHQNRECYICDRDITNVSYRCDICQFQLHTTCAFKSKNSVIPYDDKDCTVIHPYHKDHSMRLVPRPANVFCDACDDKKEDFFYHCLSCIYHIHRSCALLQSTTYSEDHPHSLSLSAGLPSVYHPFDFSCDICQVTLDKNQTVLLYYCPLCRYFVHIKCMGLRNRYERTASDSFFWNQWGSREDGVRYLPATDKSKELIHRFLLLNKELVDIPQEIHIFSHKHPLILCNEEITEEVIEDDEEILCDGCIEPIHSPPYYHCAQCRYFLHPHCANLPTNLPLHGLDMKLKRLVSDNEINCKSLTLGSKSRFYEVFKCEECHRISNGFYYGYEFWGKEYCVDVKCVASVSMLRRKSIYHEFHHHRLAQNRGFYSPRFFDRYERALFYGNCKACNHSFERETDVLFYCGSCKFFVHLECLMIPKTTRHKFDSNHPLVLRYPPHKYHERPFDCAECEKEIHPLFWLFHCEECDLSFHLECIRFNPLMGRVKFGQKLRISSHSHQLKFVREASVRSPCHQCSSDIDQDLVFECETCNFHLCRRCFKDIELIS